MSDKTIRQQKRKRRSIMLYAASGVVVVALVLYLVFRDTDRIQYQIPELAAIESDQVASIRIISETNGTVVLLRSGDTWTLGEEGFAPDGERVDEMLSLIEELTITELVSTAGYYERYELDEANRFEVIVSGKDEPLLRFDVGKRAPTYNHTYLKLADDDRVFQAEGDLRRVFERDIEALRDKTVLSFDAEAVLRIGVSTPDASYRLYRSKVGEGEDESYLWTSSDDEPWDPDAIENTLERLANLECRAFLDQAPMTDPELVLEIEGEEPYQLFVFPREESTYPARSSQTQYPFTLSSYLAEEIIETFTAGPDATPDVDTE